MVIKLNESNGYGVSEMIYDILDGHYSSSTGDINEQYLQDDVYMWLKNEKRLAKEITNTRRKVTAVVWQAFIDLINYYGNEEYGSGYGWKMDQKAVQRWFKKHGADYKEVLAPVVAEVEQLRNERLGKKESVRMKESPVYGEEVVTVESPILQNFYTELQPLNRHKLCKVEMTEYVESIPGWGRKKTITTIYPEILIRLRTDSPVTIDFTNSITIREEDGSLVAYYTTDSQKSSEVYSFDDVDAIIREIFDYDQSWARESVKRTKRRSMKESREFNPQDYYDLLYDQKRPSPDMIQAYRDYLGPDLADSYEAERIGENRLGYCDCYCCKCGQYLDKTNCPTGWYHYVSELGDDEGQAWRDFCDVCWEEVSDMSADEILDTFEPAPFGEDLGPNYKTESVKRPRKKFRK